MKQTHFPLNTTKDLPANAEIVSHKLMLKAGMIKQVSSGIYTWLPIGLRILRKVENIVREEMNKSGSLEIMMPIVQPAELWQQSGRWQLYGAELTRFKDRHDRDFCLGPTHEEVISELAAQTLNSYKDLPRNYYQIQTKFRDEIRPRFGVMRRREFIMKDAYSFHQNNKCLDKNYQNMIATYTVIFERLGLNFRIVDADEGSIGGNQSQEFHVLAQSGEDALAIGVQSAYAANVELAEALAPIYTPEENLPLEKIDTGKTFRASEIAEQLQIPTKKILKTLIMDTQDGLQALSVRGDHHLNLIKVEKILGKCTLATEEQIKNAGLIKGFIGVTNLSTPLIVDRAVEKLSNFCCGADEYQRHYINTNWKRDASFNQVADIRDVIEGDPCPSGEGTLKIMRGIEVGHIFKLGTKYSQAMQIKLDGLEGKFIPLMGCYGIGISRILGAAIEQNHDEKGIIWPKSMAPFDVALIPINRSKSDLVNETCEKLYQQMQDAGLEVFYFDDEKARMGACLANAELIGIPHCLIVGEKDLNAGEIEYRSRTNDKIQKIDIESNWQKLLS